MNDYSLIGQCIPTSMRQPNHIGHIAMPFDDFGSDRSPVIGQGVVTDFFDRHLKQIPDQAAIVEYSNEDNAHRSVSYGELGHWVSSIGAALRAHGVQKGDVVSVQLPNWWEFVAIYLACVRIGAVCNPLMPIFRYHELNYILKHSEAKVFICPQRFNGFDYKDLALRLKSEIASLKHIFFARGEPCGSFETSFLQMAPDPALSSGSALSPDDLMELLYTSGTTGAPKGVLHSSRSMLTPLMRYIEGMQLGARDTAFMAAPYAHQIGFAYGITVSMVIGATLVAMDQWNPVIAARLMAENQVTFTFAPTPILADLTKYCRDFKVHLAAFRLFATAGAPIPPTLVIEAEKTLGASVVAGWGMSECAMATSTQPGDGMADKSDGKPFPGIELQVIDDYGEQLPSGQEGNLQIRGISMMKGYLKNPALYDAEKGQWFDTGDLAKMDEQGYIRITGRKKDLVIRGGENVPVVEIENTLHKMSQVAEIAIVGKPDDRLGERACAFVTLNGRTTLSLKSVTGFLEGEGIAKQFWPEFLEILDEMPRTASGKIKKFDLRERAKSI